MISSMILVTPDLPWEEHTGYGLLTLQAIRSFARRTDVHLLALNRRHREFEVPRDLPLAGVEVVGRSGSSAWRKRARQVVSFVTPSSQMAFQAANPGDLARLIDLADRIAPRLIVFNHIRCARLLPLFRRKRPGQSKLAYFAHNAETHSNRTMLDLSRNGALRQAMRWELRKLARLERRVIAASDATIVVTAQDRGRLRCPEDNGKFHVIPPWVGSSTGEVPATAHRNGGGMLLVGSFHWYPKQKNAQWLVQEVLPRVRKRFPELPLTIVGSGADRLEASAAGLANVTIRSDVPDVTNYYDSNAVFLVPEQQEGGIKLKTLEAATLGLAVVSTPAGVEGTGLTDRKHCLVATDADTFAAAICDLIQDPSRKASLGRSARQHMLDTFTQTHVAPRYDEFLRRFGV